MARGFRVSYSGPGSAPPMATDEEEKRRLLLEQTTSPARLPVVEEEAAPPVPADVYARPAPDPTVAALAAREAAAPKRQAAALSSFVEDANAALGGTDPSRTTSRLLTQDADRIEADAVEDQKLEQLAAQARAFNEANDPNSATNARARESVRRRLPTFAAALGPEFDRMTEAQLQKALGLDSLANERRGEAAKAQFEQDKFGETKRHNRVNEQIGLINANKVSFGYGIPGQVTPGQAATHGRFLETQLINLGKDMSKVAEVTEALQTIDDLVPGITDGQLDDPNKYKLGVLEKAALLTPGGFGEKVVSQDALNMHKAQQQLIDLVSRARTGAVINEDEARLYANQFSSKAGSDPAGFARAVRDFKALLYQKIKQRQAPHASPVDPENELLTKFKGIRYTNPFFDSVRDADDVAVPAFGLDHGNGVAPAPAAPAAPTPAAPAPASVDTRPRRKDPATGEERVWDGTAWVPVAPEAR